MLFLHPSLFVFDLLNQGLKLFAFLTFDSFNLIFESWSSDIVSVTAHYSGASGTASAVCTRPGYTMRLNSTVESS